MSGRVRIGTCSNPIDGAFVRSMFAARGIPVVIGAEHHASLLGPIGGAFLTLDIWVATEDAEDAAALLRDLREGNAADAPDPTANVDPDDPELDGDGEWLARAHPSLTEDVAGERAELTDAAADGDARELSEQREYDAMRARSYRRRRAVIAILSGTFLTFGTAHIATGAWLRGLALAALEIVGILHLVAGNGLGAVAVAAAIVLDVGGTAWRLVADARTRAAADARAELATPAPRAQLPAARIEP